MKLYLNVCVSIKKEIYILFAILKNLIFEEL